VSDELSLFFLGLNVITCICMYAYDVNSNMYICIYADVYSYTRVCVRVRMYLYIYIHMYSYTYICIHIHMYIDV